MTDFETVRAHFPHADRFLYCNHAANGPMGTHVHAAVQAYIDQRRDEGTEKFDGLLDKMDECGQWGAQLMHAPGGTVGLVPHTSYGLSIAAQGIDWREGDHVLVGRGEFPSNVFPFMQLADQGVIVDFFDLDDGRIDLETLAAALHPRTRMIAVSWVQYISGAVVDLATLVEIAHLHGAKLVVDVIQGLGAFPLDVLQTGVDAAVAGGHKWMMASAGMGLMYMEQDWLRTLKSPLGWLHGPVDWDNLDRYTITYFDDARKLLTGSPNIMGMLALHASLERQLAWGPEAMAERTLENASILAGGLRERGFAPIGLPSDAEPASGIVSIRIPEPDAVRAQLMDRGVETAVRNQCLRFSPAHYQRTDEMMAVLDVFDEVRDLASL